MDTPFYNVKIYKQGGTIMSDREIHVILAQVRQRERNAEYEKDARVDIPGVKEAYQEYKENL